MGNNEIPKGEQEKLVKFRKSIIVLIGPPLVGKSTLAKQLQERSNLVFLDVDEARQEIFSDAKKGVLLPEEQETFAMINSYQKNHERARNALAENRPVLLAATYSRKIYHEMLKDLSSKTQAPLKVIFLFCSDDEIRRRLVERNKSPNISNVRTFTHYKTTRDRYQKIKDVEILELNTEKPLQDIVEAAFNFIEDLRQS